MTTRSYGQYCGFSRALELVGERWALLIIRDLLVGPKRFTELRQGLPRIPTNVLTDRLKELEAAGLIERRLLPRPEKSFVYDLTPRGRELDDIVLALGRWGAQHLGEPREHEIVTTDSVAMALRTTFHPQAAQKLRASYELRLGDITLHAKIDYGTLEVGRGPLPDADLLIEAGPELRSLMAGELSPAEALDKGSVRVKGPEELLTRFTELFRIAAPSTGA
ncbi:winged helix-turn-helix transcriptional regulator [Deinococcus planocerae]|uniref:winged helix-turn-helix transcriptional regulator n=1 Tax=Deinococcus planocerae TaxID=1737569 RepID=UPI000C7EE359|nr:helix-turn-helix domain-containing protein [Deinococcus planocerae]